MTREGPREGTREPQADPEGGTPRREGIGRILIGAPGCVDTVRENLVLPTQPRSQILTPI